MENFIEIIKHVNFQDKNGLRLSLILNLEAKGYVPGPVLCLSGMELEDIVDVKNYKFCEVYPELYKPEELMKAIEAFNVRRLSGDFNRITDFKHPDPQLDNVLKRVS